jgi:hypothetical protein
MCHCADSSVNNAGMSRIVRGRVGGSTRVRSWLSIVSLCLLEAAVALWNRIDNILNRGFLLYLEAGESRERTALLSTFYRVARYFAVLERMELLRQCFQEQVDSAQGNDESAEHPGRSDPSVSMTRRTASVGALDVCSRSVMSTCPTALPLVYPCSGTATSCSGVSVSIGTFMGSVLEQRGSDCPR